MGNSTRMECAIFLRKEGNMKQSVNPAIAGIVIAVVALIAGFFIWRSLAPPVHDDSAKPPGMPPEAAAEFQRRMGGAGSVTGPGNSGAPKSGNLMSPSLPGGSTAPTAPGSR